MKRAWSDRNPFEIWLTYYTTDDKWNPKPQRAEIPRESKQAYCQYCGRQWYYRLAHSRLQSLRPSSRWFSYAEVVFYIDHYFVSVDESYQLSTRSLTCLECRFYRNISLHCRRNFRITHDNRRRRQTVCSRKLTREANRSGGWQWAWWAHHMFLCK